VARSFKGTKYEVQACPTCRFDHRRLFHEPKVEPAEDWKLPAPLAKVTGKDPEA
jgi:hypothetical protein